jgi:hypothetical protein
MALKPFLFPWKDLRINFAIAGIRSRLLLGCLETTMRSLLMLAMLALASVPAEARRFENSYVSFDLPDDWSCSLEDTEWVCRPPLDAQGRSALVVILTAKFVGPMDSPQTYLRHLEGLTRRNGVSVVTKPEERLIGSTIWLDGTFHNSELPGYDTRYLARIEGRVGVLVTFSAHRSAAAGAQAISNGIAETVEVNSYTARPELQRP